MQIIVPFQKGHKTPNQSRGKAVKQKKDRQIGGNGPRAHIETPGGDLANGMKKLKASKENVRAFKRFLFGSAAEVEFDRQGRILIPGTLREYAQLKKDVTILGTGDKIEIWAQEAYEE